MSLGKKILGVVLVLIGGVGLLDAIPRLLFTATVNVFNPLIYLGIQKPQYSFQAFDIILWSVILIVGIYLFVKNDDPQPVR